MKTGYYITADGIRHQIKSSYSLWLDNKGIIKMVVPNGVKEVWCGNNKITELILPDGIKEVYCENNKLSELKLPDSVKYVYCDDINIPNLDKFIINNNIRINLDI